MNSTSPDPIFNSFSAATKDDLLKAAQLELGDANPFQKLTFEKENLTFLPYYDQHDHDVNKFNQLRPSSNEFLGSRAWHNMPIVNVNLESKANQIALSDLNSGADGIIFNLLNPTIDVPALLDNIEWPHCAISFTGASSEQFLNELHRHVTARKFDVKTLIGCVFRNKPIGKEWESLSLFEHWTNFHPLGIDIIEKKSAAEQIASALAKTVRQIDFLTDKGLSVSQAIQAHAFQVPIEEDFFLTIAKLKVLRILWDSVTKQYNTQLNIPLFIHAQAEPWIKKEFQPNGNMLKSTTAAMSAIFGGCDGLTIVPESSEDSMMERIARNVSSVLREESHLSKVADPTAGSYYLDSLIEQLADQSWLVFQKQMTE